MNRFVFVQLLLVVSALAAPHVSLKEEDEEPTNAVPADELNPKLNQQQVSVHHGTLADLPPVLDLSTAETNQVKVISVKEPPIESRRNGPSNGNCLCVPPQNCTIPAPGPPRSGIDGDGIPPPIPGEVPLDDSSIDGHDFLDIRIANRPLPNICGQNLVNCCVKQSGLLPVLAALKPQPIPETTQVEVSSVKEKLIKSAPNGPSNGNCLCVPPQNCTVPAPGPPGSDNLINIRIANRPLPNICGQNLVNCCVQQSVLPVLAPLTDSLGRCGASKPQPIPGVELDPTQAVFGEFPWMVVILGPNNKYIGGGALIDERHIITAAHKVAAHAASGAVIKVRLGEWDAKQNTEPLKYVELPIQQIKIHPFFNPANLKNDIAVLRLPEAVNFAAAPHVAPVCLPDSDRRSEGRRCWVTGWGKDAFGSGGQFHYILKKVDIPVLNSNDCEARLRSTRLGAIFQLDRTSFVCAGGEPGKDACQGDGGSPLVCEVEPNRFEVIGLVAWGVGCANPGIPGVYVNVASYLDWIDQQVAKP